MPSTHQLSPAAEQVRRFDRERFVTALFAPPAPREALMVLYAFNVEVARVRENVRETVAGLMRLQWWRDVVAAAAAGRMPDRHPVAGPLAELVMAHGLPEQVFDALLTAREQDLTPDPPPHMAVAEAYAEHTSAALTGLALTLLGAKSEAARAAGRHVGIAWAMAGNLRALAFHLSIGRLTLPADLMAEAGLEPEALLAGRVQSDAVRPVVRRMAQRAREHLASARSFRVEKEALPALLPATLASAHLNLLERVGWDPFDGRVAEIRPRPLRLAVAHLLGRF